MTLPPSQHFEKRSTTLALLLVVVLFTMLTASSCGSAIRIGRPTVTPTVTVTATFPPPLTPTPEPLGSANNPFVIGLVASDKDPQAAATADDLAKQISERSKQNVASKTFPSYNQLLESMDSDKVHAAWMPPLTYLYASDRGIATVVLLTNHFGVYQYGAQFLANVESNFTPYFDPISGLTSADAATALRQFDGLRPCWVEPLSPSGYVLPAGLLEENDVFSSQAVLAQTHNAVVRALYIKGICDFGATFSISGDPRTSSAVMQDLPDVMNRVLVIWRSDAVIPNMSIALQANLSEGDRQTLTNAFLDLSKSPEGRDLLSRSAGNYQVDEMKTVNDSVYDALRDAAKALDLNLRDAIGK